MEMRDLRDLRERGSRFHLRFSNALHIDVSIYLCFWWLRGFLFFSFSFSFSFSFLLIQTNNRKEIAAMLGGFVVRCRRKWMCIAIGRLLILPRSAGVSIWQLSAVHQTSITLLLSRLHLLVERTATKQAVNRCEITFISSSSR